MAEFFLDHGGYPAWVEPPAWGVAYDGDGMGADLASVATASVNFTGVSASSNSFGIMGVTLTVTGSGTTLATAVAAAINASTTAVSSAVSYTTPALRDLCYARVSGGNANVVEVMTRGGGVQLNHATNSSVAIVTAGMTGTPTITQFSGATSGAWSTFFNTSTILPTAKTLGNYGVNQNNVSGGGKLLVSPRQLTVDDVIWVRARDQQVYATNLPPSVSFYCPLRFVIDGAGEKWPDTEGKTFSTGPGVGSGSQNTGFGLRVGTGVAGPDFIFSANRRAAAVIYTKGQTTARSNRVQVANGAGGMVAFENVLWFDDSVSVSQALGIGMDYTHTGSLVVMLRDCDYRVSRAGNMTSGFGYLAGTCGGTIDWIFQGCKFIFDTLSGGHPGIIALSASNMTWQQAVFKDCVCLSAGVVYPSAALPKPATLRATNLQGFTPAPLGLFGSLANGIDGQIAVQQVLGSKKRTRLESAAVLIEWEPDVGYPTYRAFMEDGTYWSWRLTWSNATALFYGHIPTDQITLTKQSLSGDAIRTITVEILVPPEASAVSNHDIGITVGYLGSDGVVYSETTQPSLSWKSSPVALPTSSAGWELGSYPSHIKRAITLTTAHAIEGATDISVTVQFLKPAPVANAYVFVDPEFEVE